MSCLDTMKEKKLNIKFKPCSSLHWNCFQKKKLRYDHITNKLSLHHNARDNDAFTNGLQWYRKKNIYADTMSQGSPKLNLQPACSLQIFFIKIDHSFAEFQYSVKPSSDIKHYCIGYIFCYSAFIFCYRLWWKKCEPRARKHSPWNSMTLLASSCLCNHKATDPQNIQSSSFYSDRTTNTTKHHPCIANTYSTDADFFSIFFYWI